LADTDTIVPGSADAKAHAARIAEQAEERHNGGPHNGALGLPAAGNGQSAPERTGSAEGNGRNKQELVLEGMTPTGLARRLGRRA
jgi:hypothetical protein